MLLWLQGGGGGCFNKIFLFTSSTGQCIAWLNQALKRAWMKILSICGRGKNIRSLLQSLGFRMQNNYLWMIFPGKQENVTSVKVKDLVFFYSTSSSGLLSWVKVWEVLPIIQLQVSRRVWDLYPFCCLIKEKKKKRKNPQSLQMGAWRMVLFAVTCPLLLQNAFLGAATFMVYCYKLQCDMSGNGNWCCIKLSYELLQHRPCNVSNIKLSKHLPTHRAGNSLLTP